MGKRVTAFVLFVLMLAVFALPTTTSAGTTSREWTPPPPLYQDGPKCVSFAFQTWEMTEPYPSTYPVPADLLYERAKMIDGLPYADGTTLEAVTAVLQQYGRIQSFRILYSYQYIDWAGAWDHVYQARDYILEHGPIIVLSAWYSGMDYPAADHYVIPSGLKDDNHAYECYGYDGQAWAFACSNTWSEHWGYHGRFFLHAEDLARLVQQGAEIEMPVKVPADPLFMPYLMVYRIQ